MNENRYSYFVGSWRRPSNTTYLVESPEGLFEQHIQENFLKGQAHLQHEEYVLALQAFQETMLQILNGADPAVQQGFSISTEFTFPFDDSLVEALVAASANLLLSATPIQYAFPLTAVSDNKALSGPVLEALKSIKDSGLQVTSFHLTVQTKISEALRATIRKQWKVAIILYQEALALTPATELGIRGGILHDMAVLSEKADEQTKAQELVQQSVRTFSQIKMHDAHAQALATAAGMFARSGNTQKAAELKDVLNKIKTSTNLNNVITATRFIPRDIRVTAGRSNLNLDTLSTAAGEASRAELAKAVVVTPSAFSLDPSAPELMGLKFIVDSPSQKKLTIKGSNSSTTIIVEPTNAIANMRGFLDTLANTADVKLLTDWFGHFKFVAYLPHMYCFIIPMCIGDCSVGMGNLEQAVQWYSSVLSYQFINKNFEIVKVWTRLAQSYLELGDRAYRNAKDNFEAFAQAKAFYEIIVLTNRALNPDSPLYKHVKFSGIKMRIAEMLDAIGSPSQVNDNPAVFAIVVDAFSKLQQIEKGLNYFGYGPDYAPPFSFEYLQNASRYFAQNASQIEQRYIQYKSQAENEEFQRDQLDQQAQVAYQSVILEQEGALEAWRGLNVASASLEYATVELENAKSARQYFKENSYRLLEYAVEQAKTLGDSTGPHGEERYVNRNERYPDLPPDWYPRRYYLSDLAGRSTTITQGMEELRLDGAVQSAEAYQMIATAQVAQAQARLDIATQRVEIAKLQQRFAEENRDFLDMREFGMSLWFELSKQAKRLKQRYLDMATGIAFLMERAYNAETERGLKIIRYDYQQTSSGNLAGADMLLADIDLFTFDHITTTKTKKIPVKKTISIADSYPTAFRSLRTTGKCFFETTFNDFDRQHPGLYLAKIRNVELAFIGISSAIAISGTLRNIGVSRFRTSDGNVIQRLYPADMMVLSQYEIRQDALLFRFNPNDLRLFENNGIETIWQLDLPLDTNSFDYSEIFDIHLIIYYDGFFDSNLEGKIRAALPTSGNASRAFSMKFYFPDELFYLKNQGEAEMIFEPVMFPQNEVDLIHTRIAMELTGQPQTVQNLTLRLKADTLEDEIILRTDASGKVPNSPDSPLKSLHGKTMFGKWQISILSNDNPQLLQEGVLNLAGLDDIFVVSEYKFNYRKES